MFGKKNPSGKWTKQATDLSVDLNQRTLNGISLGSSLNGLSFLGPDEDRHTFRQGELSYYSQGLVVEFDIKAQTITAFHLVLDDPLEVDFTPFSQTVIKDGRSISLGLITAKNCEAQWGEVFWRDEDEEEIICFYEFTDAEWQLEFDLSSGSMKRMIVTSDPLMADPTQREMYGVTKNYPYSS